MSFWSSTKKKSCIPWQLWTLQPFKTSVIYANFSALTGKEKRELGDCQEHRYFREAAVLSLTLQGNNCPCYVCLASAAMSQIPGWPRLFTLCWVGYSVEACVPDSWSVMSLFPRHASGQVVFAAASPALVTLELSTTQPESNTQSRNLSLQRRFVFLFFHY